MATYTAIHAQLSVGAKAGVCIPNLKGSSVSSNPFYRDWASRLGPYAGLVASLNLTDHFSLQAELNYSSQGGKKKGKQGIATASLPFNLPTGVTLPAYVYANVDADIILNYVELPVLAGINFHISPQCDFIINGGPYVGYLLNAKIKSRGSSIVYKDAAQTQPFISTPVDLNQVTDIKDQIKTVNLGLQFGLGISYKMANGSIRLTGGGNIGLTTIEKDKANGEDHTGAPTVTLAYLINL